MDGAAWSLPRVWSRGSDDDSVHPTASMTEGSTPTLDDRIYGPTTAWAERDFIVRGRPRFQRSSPASCLAIVLIEADPIDRARGRAVALRDLPSHDPGRHDVVLVGAVLEADDVSDLVQRHGTQRRRVLHAAHHVAHAQLHDRAAEPTFGVGLSRHLTGATIGQLTAPEDVHHRVRRVGHEDESLGHASGGPRVEG